ncbi:hypothetical protein [Streptomyces canus]|uniref:hypothetical protein n=1 Tax=Streptomyces canus TaxID=58343 RepID=UPI002E325BEA|nr:hypothetical protein [Streptomyces canus]
MTGNLKAAALAWLSGRGESARFTFTQPDGLPVGSLLDIAFERAGRGLRVHLDPAITPVWSEEAVEPVLGVSVPVDDDTLIRRWYVHRVRFDSQGTSRRVRIGTQAFARPTEWFGLDDCEMTDDGLRTPAVDRIIRSRRTPPPRQVAFSHNAPVADSGVVVGQDERVRRLRDALRAGWVPAVTALCEAFHTDPDLAEGELAAALTDAHAFLEQQRELREDLVQQLRQAVAERSSAKVRSLLVRVETVVGRDRSKEEDDAIRTAGTFLEDQKRNAGWAHRDQAPLVRGPKFSRIRTPERPRAAVVASPRADPAAASHRRMRDLLSDLRRLAGRLPEHEIKRMIRQLKKSADEAGDHVTALQRDEIDSWATATHALYPAAPQQDPHVRQAQAAQRRVHARLRDLRRLPRADQPLSREIRSLIKTRCSRISQTPGTKRHRRSGGQPTRGSRAWTNSRHAKAHLTRPSSTVPAGGTRTGPTDARVAEPETSSGSG